MNCRIFVKRFYDYLDGTLAAPDRAEFEAHRSACERCAARLDSEADTAQLVRAAVQEACEGSDFRVPQGAQTTPPMRREHSRYSLLAGWRIPAATAALLILALLVRPIVRNTPPQSADSWAAEIHVTYEAGLRDETTLISHDSGLETIIEIEVTYHP